MTIDLTRLNGTIKLLDLKIKQGFRTPKDSDVVVIVVFFLFNRNKNNKIFIF